MKHLARRHLAPARRRRAGAALLMAMVTVTMVATLAAAMVWQQWRAVQVEAAERARAESGWILVGALDWARLILREDKKAAGKSDHLGEPWATPLAEARLSTFLAAQNDGANADDGPEAFLSGAISDAQARYNLRNLLNPVTGAVVPAELKTLTQLCAAAGLPADAPTRLAKALAQAWPPATPASGVAAPEATRPLPVQTFEQLAWLGLDPAVVERLRPFADILPQPTPVNVNTAAREVIAAVLGVDSGTAERLVQMRQRAPFEDIDKIQAQLPPQIKVEPTRLNVATSYFNVSGRLRLESRVLEERALMQRGADAGKPDVTVVRRERRTLTADTL